MCTHATFLLPILTGISFAQDTNFSVGPQYLVPPNRSPMFLRPIATPSLSLSEAQPVPANVAATEAVIAQEAPAPTTVTNQTFLSGVYWGDHSASEVEAYRVATPTFSPSQTVINAIATANEAETPATEPLPGIPPPSAGASNVIEISSGALPANLPASIFNTGVTGVTTGESLERRGYGIPLGQVAAYRKAHKTSAKRVFTNRDIQSPHGS